MPNKPRIFISHCEKNMHPTEYAMRIIELIGCEPIIAEHQPKSSNSVFGVVSNSIETCDAVIVIATGDQKNGDIFSPSNGVSEELGILKTSKKFDGKFFVIIEEGVVLSAMNSIARYSFNKNEFSQIATAILIELGSMGFFRNYYEMPGSEIEVHKLMDAIADLKKLGQNGVLNSEIFKTTVEESIRKFVNKIIES